MKLSTFILSNLECILQEWEDFASTLESMEGANKKELRDHAAAVLKVIAIDLDTPQDEHESIAKSKGLGPQMSNDTAAEIHAVDRLASGFTGEQVMAEYRALRSSVLRLWAAQVAITTPDDIQDMIRFNEAIDQAQTESMARYAKCCAKRRTCSWPFSDTMCARPWAPSAWAPRYSCKTRACRRRH